MHLVLQFVVQLGTRGMDQVILGASRTYHEILSRRRCHTMAALQERTLDECIGDIRKGQCDEASNRQADIGTCGR